jgi:hypothetical protein
VVFVACVVVKLEVPALPVAVAEPEVLPLDVEALDCADDWESGDKACQLGNHTSPSGTYYCSERSAVSGLSPRYLHVTPAMAKPLRRM